MQVFLSVDSNWGGPNGFVDAIVAAEVPTVLFSFEKLAGAPTAPVIHYLNSHQPQEHHHDDHQP